MGVESWVTNRAVTYISGLNNINNQNFNQNNNTSFITQTPMINANELNFGNGKIVSFVGTTKNGTSFIINNWATLMSDQNINVAIVDLTRNKNSYYMFTDND